MSHALSKGISITVLALVFQSSSLATSINPLDDGGWNLVAHMSNSGGMFDGNGDLDANFSFGTFVTNPIATTDDFERVFPVVADEILFITGDLSIWAIADYGDLLTLIDAKGSDFFPNLAFEIGVNGVISNTVGNVLSRRVILEDPWISIDGGHIDGVNNLRIVWGEINFFGLHTELKNNHQGLNVYVRAATQVVLIDVKPGSDPNCFNINGHGVIPVAIIGSDTFDVLDIVTDTLFFAGLEVRVRGKKGPLCHLDFVNDDGNLDLVCQFEDDSGMWEAEEGSAEAVLMGQLADGSKFEGVDSICLVP